MAKSETLAKIGGAMLAVTLVAGGLAYEVNRNIVDGTNPAVLSRVNFKENDDSINDYIQKFDLIFDTLQGVGLFHKLEDSPGLQGGVVIYDPRYKADGVNHYSTITLTRAINQNASTIRMLQMEELFGGDKIVTTLVFQDGKMSDGLQSFRIDNGNVEQFKEIDSPWIEVEDKITEEYNNYVKIYNDRLKNKK